MRRADFHASGIRNAAGFKADNFPFALGISNVNACVAETAEDSPIRTGTLHLGAGSDDGRFSVKTDFAVGNIKSGEADAAGTEAGEPFLLGLQGAVGVDGSVVVSQQRIHSAGRGRKNSAAPGFFQLVYFAMPVLVFLGLLRGGTEGRGTKGQKKQGKKPDGRS